MDFKVGDVVILQSGGVWMTVVEIGKPKDPALMRSGTAKASLDLGLVRCVWNGHGGHGEMVVPKEALKLRGEGN